VNKKKITIITSSRADFGLLNNLILTMSKSSLSLSVVFTGTHFNKNFGNTLKEFKNNKNIEVKYLKVKIISDQNYYLVKFKNEISSKLNEFLYKNRTNLILLLGDRFEILECAFTSYLLRIPIAHIHGGEVTNGSYDDAMRHSITKLSNFHFVSHNSHKKRIMQLGESSKNIFCVGSLGVDNIKKMKLKYANSLLIVIDAAHLRFCEETSRRWLDDGYWILLTGSKFIGGASFSGALLIPHRDAEMLTDIPKSMIPALAVAIRSILSVFFL
jgi:UDP-N-acetylglucosamine 2-epimerase (non-hydrolysing)/GDP/UDP-N,N'-diacetylbacillosamine 2-epimerase (hydrolysing)